MKTRKQTTGLLNALFLTGLFSISFLTILFTLNSCKKIPVEPAIQDKTDGAIQNRWPKTPPPPVYFYFTNCSNPALTGNFVSGKPTTASITLIYINAPGGAYPAFTSATINGVKLTAPAGTLNKGGGSIVFNATGTPVNPGNITIPVSIGGSITCNVPVTVLNAPPSGNCTDPGLTAGSTGCVTFNYRGQQVSYRTVRANDGKIWLQQSLGSPQVAVNGHDEASFGHYFQWGRWDDGHQAPSSPAITGSLTLQKPSHIPSGNPNFIKGTTTTTSWWGTGGLSSNTWAGTTPTATNGKDPCTAIGTGWHMPSATEWTNVMNAEWISDAVSAFDSRLKLVESGYRATSTGALVPNFVGGYYWTSTAANNNVANGMFFDNAYNVFLMPLERGYGIPCRCVKN